MSSLLYNVKYTLELNSHMTQLTVKPKLQGNSSFNIIQKAQNIKRGNTIGCTQLLLLPTLTIQLVECRQKKSKGGMDIMEIRI